MIYFVPEAAEAYAGLGITGRHGYFASRAAPMGAVSADVVVATFYNFNPDVVHAAIPSSWAVAAPSAIVDARFAAADAALRRVLGDAVESPEMSEAAALARAAAGAACCDGRPLAAAHAALPWPDDDHLVLWHATSVLREHRGDGHIAALTLAGASGIQALVMHAASGEVPRAILQSTRGSTTRGTRYRRSCHGDGPSATARSPRRVASHALTSKRAPTALPRRRGLRSATTASPGSASSPAPGRRRW
jgi:hypothetical protein